MSKPAIRALVIEDDSSWQSLLEEILTDQGLTVDVVETREDALQSLREVDYRLAIVDVSLHETNHHNTDGLAVMKALRSYAPGCVSILLTGHATVEMAVEVITQYGAFTCLRKEQFVRSEFRDTVREALAVPTLHLNDAVATLGPGMQSDPALADQHMSRTEMSEYRALIVEDDAGWRGVLSELLLEEGFMVQSCSGYGEALGHLGAQRFDLAVIDLSLDGQFTSRPGETTRSDGYRLLQFTRSSGIPTMVVSGIAVPADIERIYQDFDVVQCMEKQSFNRQAFINGVQKAVTAPPPDSVLGSLTPREQQVLRLLVKGMTNKEIAAALVISTNTVKRHLKAIFRKMNTQTRAATVAMALSLGEEF